MIIYFATTANGALSLMDIRELLTMSRILISISRDAPAAQQKRKEHYGTDRTLYTKRLKLQRLP